MRFLWPWAVEGGVYLTIAVQLFSFKLFIYLLGFAEPSMQHAEGSFCCSLWDLVSWPGIKPRPPALGAQSLSHGTTGKACLFSFDGCQERGPLWRKPCCLMEHWEQSRMSLRLWSRTLGDGANERECKGRSSNVRWGGRTSSSLGQWKPDHRPSSGFCSCPSPILSIWVAWGKPLLPPPRTQFPYELS